MNIALKILVWITAILIFLLLTGCITEQIIRLITRRQYTPDGTFCDIGDHRLHYVKKGTGGPTVIFESGLDLGGHLSWSHIQNAIAENTTALSYDRAGILWSERGTNPKTCKAVSEELKQLVTKVKCPKPYILVAHSLGGMLLRDFIQDKKNDIAGIIFIDVMHPNQRKIMEERLHEKVESPNTAIIKFFFRSGLHRLANRAVYPSLSPEDSVNVIAGKIRYLSCNAAMDEVTAIPALQNEVDNKQTFGTIPLTVIASDPTISQQRFADTDMRNDYISARNELQKDLLHLSTNSTWCHAAKSTHHVHHCQPDLVVKQIRDLILQSETIRQP